MKLNFVKINTALFLCLLFICAASAQKQTMASNSNKNENKVERQDADQPLKIKNKPTAGIGNCKQSEGAVTLKVNFDKSAKVTKAEIISPSGCDSFDKEAVSAAKKITFKPQIKNGEAVSVVKPVQYKFTRY